MTAIKEIIKDPAKFYDEQCQARFSLISVVLLCIHRIMYIIYDSIKQGVL